ncbi:hypothetical protein MAPG_08791 [Magnaporthiopsis poae ATCC 64411]|uniref:Heterokaryon incompatibility domain-containing protein n=1 Tax=Magnaporthiopsis poae (strain ATCC 64411 / 73-15) TaxID=644358 RepID=A0A0C4E894_MAGP6|nr:hypothetical protein MAPG_08791 [Magnaporthiopsis poae ATCC 64411]
MPAWCWPWGRRKVLSPPRLAASPAPSVTPSRSVRSSALAKTKHGSKASPNAAPGSCAPPSPLAAAAKGADVGVPDDHHQPPTRSGEHIPAVSEFRALVVDEINEKDVLHGVGIGNAGRLPVRLVRLPADNVFEVAVLSWRWDGDLEVRGSKNIASAVHQAKKMGIRYLFVDIVSIDQLLPGDALIKQVIAFSSLYRTIPVIAAYDNDKASFEQTIFRPWIVNEVRLFRYNPTKIAYVGHSNQGASQFDRQTTRGREIWRYALARELLNIWSGSFIETIIGVLCDEIGMTCVSDFKLIIPPYARVFTAAYEKMSRNDYLLTAVILCRVHSKPAHEVTSNVGYLNYDRYSFIRVWKHGYDLSSIVHGICLNGVHIGVWRGLPGSGWRELEALPNAERVIFAALGMTDSDYGEFVAQLETRRACLVLENSVPLPTVEVLSVTYREAKGWNRCHARTKRGRRDEAGRGR